MSGFIDNLGSNITAIQDIAVGTWSSQTTIDNSWRSVIWSPELSIFCSVSSSGTNDRVMTSPLGTVWTTRTTPTQTTETNWYSVTWSPELSLFVAVGYSGDSGEFCNDIFRWRYIRPVGNSLICCR